MLVFWLALPLAAGFAPPARGRRLAVSRRPAFDHLISAEGAVEAPCGCARPDAGFNLTQYMRLPTEQYSMLPLPYGASLRRPGADGLFELTVPPVTFLWLEVAPLVRASVDTHAETDAVIITSTDCKLRGSDVIERIRLNEAFRFFVRTRITWVDGSERRLATDTQIRVQVEPPGPFATVPRAVLEATGNAVMKVAMEGVQRGFVRALARDFEQWACDASYRTRRAGPGP